MRLRKRRKKILAIGSPLLLSARRFHRAPKRGRPPEREEGRESWAFCGLGRKGAPDLKGGENEMRSLTISRLPYWRGRSASSEEEQTRGRPIKVLCRPAVLLGFQIGIDPKGKLARLRPPHQEEGCGREQS
jgi:hypothetical protein